MIDQVLQREICGWLTANGINPRDVPVDKLPIVANGSITLFVYDYPKTYDPGTDWVRGSVTEFPLRTFPTGRVDAWLSGKRRLNKQ